MVVRIRPEAVKIVVRQASNPTVRAPPVVVEILLEAVTIVMRQVWQGLRE